MPNSLCVLYVFPASQILDKLKVENKNFVSIDGDDNVTEYIQGKSTKHYRLSEYKNLEISLSTIETIYKKLDYYSPIFSRWHHRSHHHENMKEEMVQNIIRIIKLIQNCDIKRALFCTGISHHVENYVYEIALSICNCEQIFLYPEAFSGRLLPFVHKNGVHTRTPSNFPISNFKFDARIEKLKSTRKIQDKTKLKHKIFNFLKTKYSFSLIYLFIRKVRQKLKLILIKGNFKRLTKIQKIPFSETWMSDFELVKKQKNFLSYYENNAIDPKILSNNELKLVVVANFQPESTSFPENGRVYSHIFLIAHLRSLGYSKTIYYKEHWGSAYYIQGGPPTNFVTEPSRVGMNRSANYCDSLLKLNCKLVPMAHDLSDINNMLPVTLTGSIAIERALVGLRTVYMGNPWWKGLPGAIHVSELGSQFDAIPEEWLNADSQLEEAAKNYLVKLLNYKTLENQLKIGISELASETTNFQAELKNLLDGVHQGAF